MSALRLVMLLVSVVVIYMLFLRSQQVPEPGVAQNELTAPLISPTPLPNGVRPQATPVAHSQYKQAIDRAQEVRKQMEQQHAEADAL